MIDQPHLLEGILQQSCKATSDPPRRKRIRRVRKRGALLSLTPAVLFGTSKPKATATSKPTATATATRMLRAAATTTLLLCAPEMISSFSGPSSFSASPWRIFPNSHKPECPVRMKQRRRTKPHGRVFNSNWYWYDCESDDLASTTGSQPFHNGRRHQQKQLQLQLQQRRSKTELYSTAEHDLHSFLPRNSKNATATATATATTTNGVAKNENANENANANANENAQPQDHHTPRIPRHVGLICDGNGRWATNRNLPRALGHAEGARRLVDLIRSLARERRKQQQQFRKQQQQQQQQQQQLQQQSSTPLPPPITVDCLTFYAFSTENWNRDPSEIAKIFDAIEATARAMAFSRTLREDLRIVALGDLDDPRIPNGLRSIVRELEEITSRDDDDDEEQDEAQDENVTTTTTTTTTANPPRTNSNRRRRRRRLTVCLAINYGGRRDIAEACKALAEQARDGTLDPSSITEDTVERALGSVSRCKLPGPPDLIVRTGGEHRLSNFLLWEAAYAELCVLPTLWPDFTVSGFGEALDWYAGRKRNFGGREPQ